MNPGYLYAEAEREGHGDDDEQDGKGRQNEGSDARVTIVGCNKGEKRGKSIKSNSENEQEQGRSVGRSVGRRGEQCNVREIRIDVIAVAVRVDSLLVPPKRAAVEGVTGWGCQRQAERGVQK